MHLKMEAVLLYKRHPYLKKIMMSNRKEGALWEKKFLAPSKNPQLLRSSLLHSLVQYIFKEITC